MSSNNGLIAEIRSASVKTGLKTDEDDGKGSMFNDQETKIRYASNGQEKFPQKYKQVPLTLFVKKSKTLIMLDEISEKFTVTFPKSEDTLTIDIGPEDYAKLKSMMEKDKREQSPAHNLESITECIWQEMKTDNNKLMQYYLKLSKIRLTGMDAAACCRV